MQGVLGLKAALGQDQASGDSGAQVSCPVCLFHCLDPDGVGGQEWGLPGLSSWGRALGIVGNRQRQGCGRGSVTAVVAFTCGAGPLLGPALTTEWDKGGGGPVFLSYSSICALNGQWPYPEGSFGCLDCGSVRSELPFSPKTLPCLLSKREWRREEKVNFWRPMIITEHDHPHI